MARESAKERQRDTAGMRVDEVMPGLFDASLEPKIGWER